MADDLKKGDEILYISKRFVLTLDKIKESPICKKMIELDMLKKFGINYIFCGFVL